ncbi:MAG TPA: phosphate ABC transporter permease subunit PstC [Pseudogracilibacillus sp.]|nr:phosphate ABC transporter permease subunit PstC [Pseudogracilibacillus sp.]
MTKRNIKKMIRQKSTNADWRKKGERFVPAFLFSLTLISILTTVGIVYILIGESVHFFREVSIKQFFLSSQLKPLSNEPSFGVLPLLNGTLLATAIALFIAIPIGLAIAIYLSEYASETTRKVVKPLVEILAGIPTIVYGFFAFTFVTPILQNIIPSLQATNLLSPGLVMGIMIIPMIASLSEDALHSVPRTIREGAYGLGATKLEVIFHVAIPNALSGIVAAIVLATSRAIGETMIVTIASGSSKQLTFDITQSMQTMTAYIVEVTGGDASAGSTVYYSLYAVALTLFCFTLIMNLVASYISHTWKTTVK